MVLVCPSGPFWTAQLAVVGLHSAPAAASGSQKLSVGLPAFKWTCPMLERVPTQGLHLSTLWKGELGYILQLNACVFGPGGKAGPRCKQPIPRHCRDALSPHGCQEYPTWNHPFPSHCWGTIKSRALVLCWWVFQTMDGIKGNSGEHVSPCKVLGDCMRLWIMKRGAMPSHASLCQAAHQTIAKPQTWL